LYWIPSPQPVNIPAGTAMEPGSHLTYIVDTGINARAIAGKADLSEEAEAQKTPLVSALTAPKINVDADPVHVDPGSMFQNFIAITNTNPTLSVTVHFRYFNDNCEDVLDFLVVLTCNDTLLFDPFNFVIPYTGGENTMNRLIGPPGDILDPITVNQWGSGRFVITAAASGTAVNDNEYVDILFPYEWQSLYGESDHRCNMNFDAKATYNPPTDDVRTILGTVPNVGVQGGLRTLNLHVFNAKQLSFNYLIGSMTTAVPQAFIQGVGTVQAYGLPAWARPAVERAVDMRNLVTGFGDGNGPQAPVGALVLGFETLYLSNGVKSPTNVTNTAYLRNDVHGGDLRYAVNGGYSYYGALGTVPFFPDPKQDDQAIHLLSVSDDYNGNNNASGFGFGPKDFSANISPAITTYILQIYDSDEHILTFEIPPEAPVSPPELQAEVVLKITCICLRVYMDFLSAGEILFNGSTDVDVLPTDKGGNQTGALELDDLNYFGDQVFDGLAAIKYHGLLKTNIIEAGTDYQSEDLSGGWIRFVRDNTVWVRGHEKTPGVFEGIPADAGTTITGAKATGAGTSTVNDPIWADNGALGPSFMTMGFQVLRFEGYGAAWYLHTVASNPGISDSGQEVAPE